MIKYRNLTQLRTTFVADRPSFSEQPGSVGALPKITSKKRYDGSVADNTTLAPVSFEVSSPMPSNTAALRAQARSAPLKAPVSLPGQMRKPLPKIMTQNERDWGTWTRSKPNNVTQIIAVAVDGVPMLGRAIQKDQACVSGFIWAVYIVEGGGVQWYGGGCFTAPEGSRVSLIVPPALWYLEGIQNWKQARVERVMRNGKLESTTELIHMPKKLFAPGLAGASGIESKEQPMTKQNRNLAQIRTTFVADRPSFVSQQPGVVGAPLMRAPVSVPGQMRKPLPPKITNRKAIASHVASLASQIELTLLPVAKLHRELKDTLKWVMYYDTISDVNSARKRDRLDAEWYNAKRQNVFAAAGEETFGKVVDSTFGFDTHSNYSEGKPYEFSSNEAKLKALMAQRPGLEASAAGKATSLAKQMATYMAVHGATIAAAQSLVTETVNAVEQFDKQFDVPCPASYVRDPKLPGPAYSVPCIFNTSGQVALEQAILRSRDLQQLVSQQYGGAPLAQLAGAPSTLGAPVGRPAMYVIAAGDTTSGIAEKLGVTVPALLAANHGRPTMQIRSGHRVFKTLTEREKLNVPRQRALGLAGAPGALSAGPGEACGYTDWCDSGYLCENGVCVPDFVPAQAGLSNTGSYCDAGGGPQSGFVAADGSCTPIGGDTSGTRNNLVGNVVCPGPNMHPDLDNISAWQCICDEGFTEDPNGPGCVPVGTAGTGGVGSQQFYEECMKVGGEIDPETGLCRAKGGVSGQGTQFKEPKTGGGNTAGGGKTSTTTGGKAGPVEPVDAKTGLIGSLSSTAKTVLMVGGGVLAVAAVGGGAFLVAKHRKDAKLKGKGKDEKKDEHKALPGHAHKALPAKK